MADMGRTHVFWRGSLGNLCSWCQLSSHRRTPSWYRRFYPSQAWTVQRLASPLVQLSHDWKRSRAQTNFHQHFMMVSEGVVWQLRNGPNRPFNCSSAVLLQLAMESLSLVQDHKQFVHVRLKLGDLEIKTFSLSSRTLLEYTDTVPVTDCFQNIASNPNWIEESRKAIYEVWKHRIYRKSWPCSASWSLHQGPRGHAQPSPTAGATISWQTYQWFPSQRFSPGAFGTDGFSDSPWSFHCTSSRPLRRPLHRPWAG